MKSLYCCLEIGSGKLLGAIGSDRDPSSFGHLPTYTLPYVPIWPGFAINTIFYAAMLWLLWIAPGRIKRVIRIRGHRCPACGYQIAPGGGIGPVCSECGAALPAAWSTNES
jgi:hypothetical protein